MGHQAKANNSILKQSAQKFQELQYIPSLKTLEQVQVPLFLLFIINILHLTFFASISSYSFQLLFHVLSYAIFSIIKLTFLKVKYSLRQSIIEWTIQFLILPLGTISFNILLPSLLIGWSYCLYLVLARRELVTIASLTAWQVKYLIFVLPEFIKDYPFIQNHIDQEVIMQVIHVNVRIASGALISIALYLYQKQEQGYTKQKKQRMAAKEQKSENEEKSKKSEDQILNWKGSIATIFKYIKDVTSDIESIKVNNNSMTQKLNQLSSFLLSGELLLANLDDAKQLQRGEQIEIKADQEVNILEQLSILWQSWKRIMGQKGLVHSVKVITELPEKIKFDKTKFNQILYNLINNAIKNTEVGHIAVSLEWISQEEDDILDAFQQKEKKEQSKKDSEFVKDIIANEEQFGQNIFIPFVPGSLQTDPATVYFQTKEGDTLFERLLATHDDQEGDLNHHFKCEEEVDSFEKRGILILKVQDSGKGINKEQQAFLSEILDRNKLKNNNQNNSNSGILPPHGLGLWLTKKFCELLDGSMMISSAHLQGTTIECRFRVYYKDTLDKTTRRVAMLPVEPGLLLANEPVTATQSQRNSVQKNKPSENKIQAFIADEDDRIILEIQSQLRELGVEVLKTYNNGDNLLADYKQKVDKKEKVDLIIMSTNLSDGNTGKITLAKIRQLEFFMGRSTQPPYVVMIGEKTPSKEVDDLLSVAGPFKADFFIHKPLTFDDLELRVEFLKQRGQCINQPLSNMSTICEQAQSLPFLAKKRLIPVFIKKDQGLINLLNTYCLSQRHYFIFVHDAIEAESLFRTHCSNITQMIIDLRMEQESGFRLFKAASQRKNDHSIEYQVFLIIEQNPFESIDQQIDLSDRLRDVSLKGVIKMPFNKDEAIQLQSQLIK